MGIFWIIELCRLRWPWGKWENTIDIIGFLVLRPTLLWHLRHHKGYFHTPSAHPEFNDNSAIESPLLLVFQACRFKTLSYVSCEVGSGLRTRLAKERYILLMAEILHQLIGSLSHYLQGFIHPRWCRISAINSMFFLPKQFRTISLPGTMTWIFDMISLINNIWLCFFQVKQGCCGAPALVSPIPKSKIPETNQGESLRSIQ